MDRISNNQTKNLLKTTVWHVALNIIASLSILINTGCATFGGEDPEDPEVTRMAATTRYVAPPENKYESLIARRTVNDALYKGLTNIFQYHATILTNDVIEEQVVKKTAYNKWDPSTSLMEKEKALQEASTTLRVFLAFYAPDRPNNKILGKEGAWKFYVQIAGQKYPGIPKKAPMNLPEIRRLYPYMDPWVTGYIIEFPVPTSAAHFDIAKFTLTGPAGTSEKEFLTNGHTRAQVSP